MKISKLFSPHPSPHRLIIWLVGVSFLLFQFFLQLSSGVLIGAIMHDLHLTAFTASILSSAFYYVYASLQIPVGVLFDRLSTRKLLTLNAGVCSLGCLLFAIGNHLPTLFLGRLLMGAGSAFAFVGMSHLLRQHFPLKQFAFWIGLSETLAFIITVLGLIGTGALITIWGWRAFIQGAGLFGLFITLLCCYYIPESTHRTAPHLDYRKEMLRILSNKQLWINGLYAGLCFSIVTVFSALWAIPFFQVKLHCTLSVASVIDACFFIGAALSCPGFGMLSQTFSRRKPLLISSAGITACLAAAIIYLPIHSHGLMGFLMFLLGFGCGAYMLTFSIANELVPPGLSSFCIGFTNTLAVIAAPILQPLIGFLLDYYHTGATYTLHDYHIALFVVPCSLLLATILATLLSETKHSPSTTSYAEGSQSRC